MSYTFTTTNTFTRTRAEYVASKVAADLRRMNNFYGHSGHPTESEVDLYYRELVEYLVHGFLDNVEYGFKKNDQRIVSLKYKVETSGLLSDSHAGGVYARVDISGATWFSYLSQNSKFFSLSLEDSRAFRSKFTLSRSTGEPPKEGLGYWITDRTYSADGMGTQRQTFRPY
jgi:hypothetical protein